MGKFTDVKNYNNIIIKFFTSVGKLNFLMVV